MYLGTHVSRGCHHYHYYCWVTEVGTAAMIQVRPSSRESSTVFLSVEITFSGVLRLLEIDVNTLFFLYDV